MNGRYLDLTVLGRRELTGRVAEFVLGARDGSPLPQAEAGAHVELRFGGGGRGPFVRHYSLVGPLTPLPVRERLWRIAVRREDRHLGSAYLHECLHPGDRVQAAGPFGSFRTSHGAAHHELIAGGIGITALLPMVRALRIRQESFRLLLIGPDQARLPYLGEVLVLGGEKVVVHETSVGGRPDLTGWLRSGPRGGVGTVAQVCGPPGLVDDVRAAATTLGWSPEQVRSESFTPAHRPGDRPFTVRTTSGRLVRVPAGVSALEALEAAGVDTLADCRRGECGLCLTRVVHSENGIDHRDHCLTDEQRSDDDRMTLCCSRPRGDHVDLDL